MAEVFKKCSKCHDVKPLSFFYNRKDTLDKKQSWCKSCDKIRTYNYIEKNKEKIITAQKNRVNKNKNYINKLKQKWRKENKQRCAYHSAERRALKLKATPTWADNKKIQSYYTFASFMKYITLGIEYHVDHIVPLKGKNVCGLHTHDNLQVLRKDLNLAKSNRYEE